MSIPSANPERAAGSADRDSPGLAYIRIPKTASTTVVHLIAALPEFSASEDRPARQLRRAHATWGQYASLLEPGSGWVAIATFRDSVERVVSFYRQLQRASRKPGLPEDSRPSSLEAAARPLRDLLEDEASLFHISTSPLCQCRRTISGLAFP